MDRTTYLHNYYLNNKVAILERVKARNALVRPKKIKISKQIEKINKPITINFHI